MSLNVSVSEIVPMGITVFALTTSGLASVKKPNGFTYQPNIEQIRVPGFSETGRKTMGIPQVVGEDYTLTLNYQYFNPQIAAKLTQADVAENYFDCSATFANTDGSTFAFSFADPSLVITTNYALDPLGSMSLTFVSVKPAVFAF